MGLLISTKQVLNVNGVNSTVSFVQKHPAFFNGVFFYFPLSFPAARIRNLFRSGS